MKNKWLFIFFLSVLITFFTALPASALKTAGLFLPDPYITVGESFEVQVSVADVADVGEEDFGDLTSFGFDVDPLGSLTFFSYDGYSIGTDFTDTGYNDIFSPVPISSFVAGLYFPSDPFATNAGTNVWLATLSFTAGPNPGTDTLTIEGLWDGGFYGLYYLAGYPFDSADDGTGNESILGSLPITINVASIPEPATLLLLGSGLVGLAGFRKKFRRS